MPGMDGVMLAEEIRHDAAFAGLSIIVLASPGKAESAGRNQGLSLLTSVHKPIKQSALLAAVESELRLHPYISAWPLRSPQASDEQRRSLKILVAEDNVVNQRLVMRLLEKQGHFVAVANNGAEALGRFEQESFDVVLMDIQMPVLSGLEATAAIREREKKTGSRIPIIAVTTNAMNGDESSYLAAGMDGYVPKPIRIQTLLSTIDELVYAPRVSTI